jgi:hypothetical protein
MIFRRKFLSHKPNVERLKINKFRCHRLSFQCLKPESANLRNEINDGDTWFLATFHKMVEINRHNA